MLTTNRIVIICEGKTVGYIKEFTFKSASDSLYPLIEIKTMTDMVSFYLPEKITTENSTTYFFVKEMSKTLASQDTSISNVVSIHSNQK